MKKIIVILLLLPVGFVLVFVLGRMRWKFSKPAPRPAASQPVTTNAPIAAPPPTDDLPGNSNGRFLRTTNGASEPGR